MKCFVPDCNRPVVWVVEEMVSNRLEAVCSLHTAFSLETSGGRSYMITHVDENGDEMKRKKQVLENATKQCTGSGME